MYFILDGLILFRKGDFRSEVYVFRVVFEGGFLGGVRKFWGNPYLNSTTVLFDCRNLRINIIWYKSVLLTTFSPAMPLVHGILLQNIV